jgi:hypothetical protein
VDRKSISDRRGKALIVKNPDQRSGILLALLLKIFSAGEPD